MAKAAALVLIVALGDSTTAGTPYFRSPIEAPPRGSGDPRGSWVHWAQVARPAWSWVNQGVNGERTDQFGERLDAALERRPKYLVILGGVNDVYQGVPEADTRRALSGLYDRAAAGGATPVAAGVLPFDRATREQTARIRSLNAWIREEAARRGLAFCDTHAAAADPKNPARLRGSPDGLHPDVATARRVARAVLRALDALEGKAAEKR